MSCKRCVQPPCWTTKQQDMHMAPGAAASCKAQLIRRLIARLIAEGHRTLLFSQSRVMLDVIGSVLAARGVAFLRIDGTIASAAERQARLHVQIFFGFFLILAALPRHASQVNSLPGCDIMIAPL